MYFEEEAMSEGIVQPSEALEEALLVSLRTLMLGLYPSKTCGSVQMIAAPVSGICIDCGTELKGLSSETPPGAAVPKIEIAA
jgi:hypothetical protein